MLATASVRRVAINLLSLAMLRTTGRLMRRGMAYQRGAFQQLERQGIHITDAAHFEDPVPNVALLERSYPETDEHSYPGIEFNGAQQLEILTTVIARHAAEFRCLPPTASNGRAFGRSNDSFAQLDALAYWSIIRSCEPDRIVEIGSGSSTLLAHHASADRRVKAELTVIDPCPRQFTRDFLRSHPEITWLNQPVQEVHTRLFEGLGFNDILFIDGSHILKIGSDVDYLINAVLPRLAAGVWIHVHDIYLPFQYPRRLFLEEHRFWNEQHALAMYLAENNRVQVRFGSQYVLNRFPEHVAQIIPEAGARVGVSFWFSKT